MTDSFAVTNLTAFVDWRSQMHNCGLARTDYDGSIEQATRTFNRTSSVLIRALDKFHKGQRFRIAFRLYHGWTKGFEPTQNRKAISIALKQIDFAALSPRRNVICLPDVEFGDVMLAALPIRLSQPRQIHLPGTLREEDGRRREKMVDTALATDLLVHARNYPDEWAVLLAEDDDLVPPLFTAEAWRHRTSGRVYLLRKREPTHSVLKIDDLKLRGQW